jgi:hypothetical protein
LVGILVLAFDKVVATELVVRLSTLQYMIRDHKDRVRNGDDGFVVPVATLDPCVLGGKIGALGPRRGLR